MSWISHNSKSFSNKYAARGLRMPAQPARIVCHMAKAMRQRREGLAGWGRLAERAWRELGKPVHWINWCSFASRSSELHFFLRETTVGCWKLEVPCWMFLYVRNYGTSKKELPTSKKELPTSKKELSTSNKELSTVVSRNKKWILRNKISFGSIIWQKPK